MIGAIQVHFPFIFSFSKTVCSSERVEFNAPRDTIYGISEADVGTRNQ